MDKEKKMTELYIRSILELDIEERKVLHVKQSLCDLA